MNLSDAAKLASFLNRIRVTHDVVCVKRVMGPFTLELSLRQVRSGATRTAKSVDADSHIRVKAIIEQAQTWVDELR